ncbi:MAG: hypothetical protein NTZ09_11665, partial [Candidatus Hydrogenedentes bacterium]|nr:hypothetical protein [Candidatus Hydrogenedentota bacterium]
MLRRRTQHKLVKVIARKPAFGVAPHPDIVAFSAVLELGHVHPAEQDAEILRNGFHIHPQVVGQFTIDAHLDFRLVEAQVAVHVHKPRHLAHIRHDGVGDLLQFLHGGPQDCVCHLGALLAKTTRQGKVVHAD